MMRRQCNPWVCRGAGGPFLAGEVESISSLSPDFYQESQAWLRVLGLPSTVYTTDVQLEADQRFKLIISGSLFSLFRQLIMGHKKVRGICSCLVCTCQNALFHSTVLGPNVGASPKS